jgi:RNA polymerase sigma-70 factor (ECF subfamily)
VSVEEARLVKRCLRGDTVAIRDLVERFQTDVFSLCCKLLGDRHEAEDVSQEVFLRVFRSLHRWDSARPLKPWIVGIAVNRCRTFLTQRKRRVENVDYLHELAIERPSDDSAELVREIRLALAELRPEYRSVFVLFHEQGRPYEFIAEALERPVGTIKTWLHRARLQVLERLRERGMVSEVGHELP